MDRGAFAHSAVNGDEALRLFDGGVHGSKARPRALFLGREERLHCTLVDFRGHAVPRITDAQPYEVAGPRVRDASGGIRTKGDVVRFDRDRSAHGHRRRQILAWTGLRLPTFYN